MSMRSRKSSESSLALAGEAAKAGAKAEAVKVAPNGLYSWMSAEVPAGARAQPDPESLATAAPAAAV